MVDFPKKFWYNYIVRKKKRKGSRKLKRLKGDTMNMFKTFLKILQIILWAIVFAFVTWFVISYIWVLFTNLNPATLPFWNFFTVATSH